MAVLAARLAAFRADAIIFAMSRSSERAIDLDFDVVAVLESASNDSADVSGASFVFLCDRGSVLSVSKLGLVIERGHIEKMVICTLIGHCDSSRRGNKLADREMCRQ